MLMGKGELTLIAGSKTVSVPRISADAIVMLSRKSALGTIGDLGWSINPGVSFTIIGVSVFDVSVVRWAVMA